MSALDYRIALVAACIIALITRRDDMRRAVFVMIGNLACVWSFNAIFGTYCPWLWIFTIDCASAYLMMRHPTNRMQITIAVLFLVQAAFDGAYGALQANHGFPDPPMLRHLYWEWLLKTSWVQVLILGGWGAGHGGRIMYSRWRIRHPRRIDAHGSEPMGGKQ